MMGLGIINRLLLFIAALLLAVLALLGLGAALALLPEAAWLAQVRWALAQKETILVLAFLFVMTLHLLGVATRSQSGERPLLDKGEVLTLQTEHGEVQVALVAIKNLLSRTLTEIHGVRAAEVIVAAGRARKDALLPEVTVKVNLVLGREAAVQAASDAVRTQAASVLDTTFGLHDVPVTVRVADVTDAPVKGRRVV